MGIPAWIGLGSNLGDRRARLDAAVKALSETPGIAVRAVSSFYETAPVGGPGGQEPFLNAAAQLETDLGPEHLLQALHAVEHQQGRVRSVRWGERTLDLDLLLYGDQIIETPELTVPHPRFAWRRFVLAPLAEIAPAAIDPWTGRSVAELLERVDRRPSYVAIVDRVNTEDASDTPGSAAWLAKRLAEALFAEVIHLEEKGAWEDQIESAARGLRRDRWTRKAGGNGWVVSDFWLDALIQSRQPEGRPHELAEQLRELRSWVLEPIFVVALNGSAAWVRKRQQKDMRPIGWDTPILVPEAIAPESIVAEVLAACASFRPG
jgi:2-amino-4-hydroxy-6-hydroxymethyldihydropteridine diphosphokinase